MEYCRVSRFEETADGVVHTTVVAPIAGFDARGLPTFDEEGAVRETVELPFSPQMTPQPDIEMYRGDVTPEEMTVDLTLVEGDRELHVEVNGGTTTDDFSDEDVLLTRANVFWDTFHYVL